MERFKSSLNYIAYKITQKWTVIGVLAVVTLLSWVAVYAAAQSNQLQVHFFDVGQGDAILTKVTQ